MRRIVVALVLAGSSWFLSACSSTPAQQGPAPDLIIVNAKVYTVDPSFSTAEAVAVTGGKFTAVGSTADIQKLAGATTKVIDAEGKTLIPGLMDNHLHNAGGGPGVDLSRARSLDDVLQAIGERVKTTDPGEVVVTNADWHEAQLKEQRLPYRADLDTVAPNTAVVVVRGGHEYILNTAALKKWNITKATPQPAGGRISRDEKGELNGELVDRAKALVQLPPDENRMNAEYFLAEHKKLNASGLTGIRYPGAPAAQYRILQQLEKEGKLTIRVNQLMRAQQAVTLDQMKQAIDSWGVKQDEGNEWLRVGGVKMGVDGGFEGGWMSELYEKPFDEGGKYYGINTLKQEPYTEIVKELNRQGWRVSTHAVGDAAIDEVLAAYEAADAEKSIAGRRWTVEHGFIPRADQFPRMKKLDLAISAQNHLYLAGPSLVKMWGPKRAAWVTPVRAYLDAGLPTSLGTDSSVVPYPPLWVFYHFVTRDTITGGVLGEDQKITRQEALKGLTISNAWLTFEEKTKGSIEVGKFADMVLLPEDLMTVEAKKVEQMQVLMTIVGGKIVYQQDGFQPKAVATN
ncbi:MAG: amidohydrolase [Vicinamibacterales bacterium]